MEKPWKRTIENVNVLATNHSKYATKIAQDLIGPLSTYDRTPENGNMGMLERNLTAVAKDMHTADTKLQKAESSKSKNRSSKQSDAQEEMRKIRSKWDSESPNGFERLQQVDESRVAFLRDALVRYETSSMDLYTSQIKQSETTIAALLEVSPTDEPMDFVTKKLSTHTSASRPGPGLSRTVSQGDSGSIRSSGGAASSLKSKFGTLLKGRRATSPTKRQSITQSGASNSQLARSTLPETIEEPVAEAASSTLPRETNGRAQSASFSFTQDSPVQQQTIPEVLPTPVQESNLFDHNETSNIGNTTRHIEVESRHDGAPTSPHVQQAFRGVSIHDSAISAANPDEDDAAIDRVSSTLKAQPTISRRARGRRDVRNTVYGGSATEGTTDPQMIARDILGSPLPQAETSSPFAVLDQQAPTAFANRSHLLDRQSTASAFSHDGNESIRSGRSSVSKSLNRHPEPTADGLHLSVIETVSAHLSQDGASSNFTVTGEAAMSYKNPLDDAPLRVRIQSPEAIIRLVSNDHVTRNLEQDLYELPSRSIPNMNVLFKYQVQPESSRQGRFLPILFSQKWSPEANQTSVKVTYRLNPSFGASSLALHDVEIAVSVDGDVNSCVAKPAGTFVKKSSKLVWRLNELLLESNKEGSLLARFKTEAMCLPSDSLEIKFKTLPSNLARGSGFGVFASKSRSNPFADSPTVENVLVQNSYVLQSGKLTCSTASMV